MKTSKLCLFGLALWAGQACAPSTQFKSSNLADASAEVETKSAGMNTSSDGRASAQSGRITLDCFIQTIDAAKLSDEPIKAVGIPSNCPTTSASSSSSTSSSNKFDVAIAIDTSENMIDLGKAAKKEIALALNKLNSEKRMTSLSAFAFRSRVSATERGTDIAKTIELISGESSEWSANGLKVLDPNSTEWISNDAAKAVFPALQEAISALQAGSQPDKILILVTGSTGKGPTGFDVGIVAKSVSDLSASVSANGGQLIFNYAASEKLASGLSEYAPVPIAQLDLLSSAAAMKPVRALLPSGLGRWGENIVSRASIPSTSTEECLVTKIEGSDVSGAPVFQKEVVVTDKVGFQEATLPKVLHGVSFKVKLTRKCKKSGEISQNIVVKAAKESTRK